MERPIGAQCDYPLVRNHRSGARAVAFAKIILEAGGIDRLPLLGSIHGVQRLDYFLILDAVEKNQARARHNGAAEAFTDAFAPNERWALRGPGHRQPGFRGSAVARWPKELWPIRGRSRGNREQGKKQGRSFDVDHLSSRGAG